MENFLSFTRDFSITSCSFTNFKTLSIELLMQETNMINVVTAQLTKGFAVGGYGKRGCHKTRPCPLTLTL